MRTIKELQKENKRLRDGFDSDWNMFLVILIFVIIIISIFILQRYDDIDVDTLAEMSCSPDKVVSEEHQFEEENQYIKITCARVTEEKYYYTIE